MAARKGLSLKVRFEVFKRDAFKCQYCGKCAPDVVLHVDHINPVAKGGKNEMLNLITACFDCNLGKKDRKLDDTSEVEKQRKQLEEVSERRAQLKMMLAWRDEMKNLDSDKINVVTEKFTELTGYNIIENGLLKIRKVVKKYDLNLILDSLDDAANQYLIPASKKEAKYTQESAAKVLDYIPKICASKLKMIEKPYLRDIYMILSIAKRKYRYFVDWQAMSLLEKAYLNGYSKATLMDIVNESNNWTQFTDTMGDLLEGVG